MRKRVFGVGGAHECCSSPRSGVSVPGSGDHGQSEREREKKAISKGNWIQRENRTEIDREGRKEAKNE